jgi:hypothetical protein
MNAAALLAFDNSSAAVGEALWTSVVTTYDACSLSITVFGS